MAWLPLWNYECAFVALLLALACGSVRAGTAPQGSGVAVDHGRSSQLEVKGESLGTQGWTRVKRKVVDLAALQLKRNNKRLPAASPPYLPGECSKMRMDKEDMLAFVQLLSDKSIARYIEFGGAESALCAAHFADQGTPGTAEFGHAHRPITTSDDDPK